MILFWILIALKVIGGIGLGVLAVELFLTLRKISRYIDRQEERQNRAARIASEDFRPAGWLGR